jgi:N-acetylmuramoyl-L-alanine amidase
VFKLYVSPSVQEKNIGVDGISEEERMQTLGRNVGSAIVDYAQRRGIPVEVRYNRPEMTLAEIVADSDRWGADAHLALHTNAGPPAARGMEIYAHGGDPEGEKFAACLVKHLKPLGIKIRGDKDETPDVRDPQKSLGHRLAEVDKVKADAACLIEFAFHTNREDLSRLLALWPDLVKVIRCGVIEYVKGVMHGAA